MTNKLNCSFDRRSQLQDYGWNTFCVEFLCGIVTIVWYLLALAERNTLRMVTHLQSFGRPSSRN